MQKEKVLNFSELENRVETNWYKFYENIPKHLDYPDISIFQMLEKNSLSRLNLIAYNYFGKKATYKKLFTDIEDCAKALKNIGVKENDRVTICMPNTPQASCTLIILRLFFLCFYTCSSHQTGKQRMCFIRPAFKFRMVLYPHKKWMIF